MLVKTVREGRKRFPVFIEYLVTFAVMMQNEITRTRLACAMVGGIHWVIHYLLQQKRFFTL